jgi:hypothetical protein
MMTYSEKVATLPPQIPHDLDGEVQSEDEEGNFADGHKQREAANVRYQPENVDPDLGHHSAAWDLLRAQSCEGKQVHL